MKRGCKAPARKAQRYREALTYFRRYLDDEPSPSPVIREELDQHVRQPERMVRDAEQLRQMASSEGGAGSAPASWISSAAPEPAGASSDAGPAAPADGV